VEIYREGRKNLGLDMILKQHANSLFSFSLSLSIYLSSSSDDENTFLSSQIHLDGDEN
jgi:hypothetical protein